MSGSDPRATARAEYDQAAMRLPGLTVLNYGFHDAAAASGVDDGEPERFCLRLYEHVAGGSTLAGATVLEVFGHLDERTFGPLQHVGGGVGWWWRRRTRGSTGSGGCSFGGRRRRRTTSGCSTSLVR